MSSESGLWVDQARQSAQAGIAFLLRHQIINEQSADCGRFAFVYDCVENRTITLSTNWTTGIAIEALIAGYGAFGDERYREAAGRGVRYLYSLQYLDERNPRVNGVFREVTPQSNMAHPRDALTAAWALLDWYELTGEMQALERALIYADWFERVGMEKGYPYWTVRFDDQAWEPTWCGSFHSGSAFFMARMFEQTREERFRIAMCRILDEYNTHHLLTDGRIQVILDRDTHTCLDGIADERFSNRGWEMMHVYNDDFGALANLSCWQITNEMKYSNAASLFLNHMAAIQRSDGGFGPVSRSVPSAGGAVLMQMAATRILGLDCITQKVLDNAAAYLLAIQVRQHGHASDGAFHGFDDAYQLNKRFANLRSGAYAILALLRYAGYQDRCYYFGADKQQH